jgi:hypothetical protein
VQCRSGKQLQKAGAIRQIRRFDWTFRMSPLLNQAVPCIKVNTLHEAQAPEVLKWIEQAGRVNGWSSGELA